VKERLEDVLRPDEVADDLVLLLRVESTRVRSHGCNARHGTWTDASAGGADRATGSRCWRQRPETEVLILATRMDARRRYCRILYRDIAGRLLVLPTFRRPHWTVIFNDPDDPDYQPFVDAYGELRDNPCWTRKPGRRPR
jgi:hypothetical protein